MGFNRVAFGLNDRIGDLKRSPRTALHLLMDAGYGECRQDLSSHFDEPFLSEKALKVFPSFHADYTKYYRAGGNCCVELTVHKTYRRNGKKYIVLEAPDWDK